MKRLWICGALAAMSGACGGGAQQVAAPEACATAKVDLKRQLGPELGTIAKMLPLPIGAVPEAGCALVYTRVPEESPEELPEEDREAAAIDQGLAILLPDGKGRMGLTLMSASDSAPGLVGIDITLNDLTGDKHPELVVIERSGVPGAGGFKGLRVVAFGTAGTRLQLDTPLVLKTAEGLELMANWQSGREGDRPAVLVEAGGVWQVFAFNPSEQRFALDPVATAKRNPNRVPAADPTTSAKPAANGIVPAGDPEIGTANKSSGSAKTAVGTSGKGASPAEKAGAVGTSGKTPPPAKKPAKGGKGGKSGKGAKPTDAPDPNVPKVDLP